MNKSKQCFICREVKSAVDFYPNTNGKYGLSSACRVCHKARSRAVRAANPEKVKAANKRRYAERKAENPNLSKESYREQDRRLRSDPARFRAETFIGNNYSSRHKRDKDVTRQYLIDLFRQATHCACCGVPLRIEVEPAEQLRGRKRPDTPSVDRVDNNKGYTRQNIAIICLRCNTLKGKLTLDDLALISLYIRRHSHV